MHFGNFKKLFVLFEYRFCIFAQFLTRNLRFFEIVNFSKILRIFSFLTFAFYHGCDFKRILGTADFCAIFRWQKLLFLTVTNFNAFINYAIFNMNYWDPWTEYHVKEIKFLALQKMLFKKSRGRKIYKFLCNIQISKNRYFFSPSKN